MGFFFHFSPTLLWIEGSMLLFSRQEILLGL